MSILVWRSVSWEVSRGSLSVPSSGRSARSVIASSVASAVESSAASVTESSFVSAVEPSSVSVMDPSSARSSVSAGSVSASLILAVSIAGSVAGARSFAVKFSVGTAGSDVTAESSALIGPFALVGASSSSVRISVVESPASAAACVRSLAVKFSAGTAGLEAACVDDSGARSLAVKFSAGTAGSDVAAESSVPEVADSGDVCSAGSGTAGAAGFPGSGAVLTSVISSSSNSAGKSSSSCCGCIVAGVAG